MESVPLLSRKALAHCEKTAEALGKHLQSGQTVQHTNYPNPEQSDFDSPNVVNMHFPESQNREEFGEIKSGVRKVLERHGFEFVLDERMPSIMDAMIQALGIKDIQEAVQGRPGGELFARFMSGPEERRILFLHREHPVGVQIETHKAFYGPSPILRITFIHGQKVQEEQGTTWQPINFVPKAIRKLRQTILG
ncbi:hypothetical protein HY572_06870 [Candidatus Micrarchaeota archaeon]|nr:hypothetical protein [Candidatus Micrarchaeota archaeon]